MPRTVFEVSGMALTDAEREAVLAKARRDRAAAGLPESVEDDNGRRNLGDLLTRVSQRLSKVHPKG